MQFSRNFVTAFLLLAAPWLALAADEGEPPRRAARPTFPPDVESVFFADAREQLVGERPGRGAAVAAGDGAPAAASAAGDGERFAWSRLVSGQTLADEVKRIANGLQAPLANAGKFRSGGFQQCRRDFGLLAVLFAVAAQYDGETRFADNAAALRDQFARAAAACQAATDDSLALAQQRRYDLEDLMRGQSVAAPDAAEQPPAWGELATLSLLMQRMETALEERVDPAVASERTFRRAELDVQREAQLLAMLAEVIQREGFDFADDDQYAAFAQRLQDAAGALNHAAEERNYEAARAAAGQVGQACAACHEDYRG